MRRVAEAQGGLADFGPAVAAYRRGRAVPYQESLAASGSRFNEELDSALVAILGAADRQFVADARAQTFAALQFARKDRLADSSQLFNEIGTRIATHQAQSAEAVLLGQTFFQAASAYFDFKCERWDMSQERLRAALATDELLENQFGLHLMQLHRVQLLHNLVRLLARSGHGNEAVALADSIVGYAAGSRPSPSVDGSWDKQVLLTQPGDLRAAMLEQVFAEVALIMVDATPAAASDYWNRFTAWNQVSPASSDQARLWLWCEAEEARVRGNIAGFLARAQCLLEAGRTGSASVVLWYAALLHLMDMAGCEGIRREAAQDARSSGNCPPKILHLLELPDHRPVRDGQQP